MLGEKQLLAARDRAMVMRPWYGPFLTRFMFVKREGAKQPLYHDNYGRVYYNDGYASMARVETLSVLLIQIAEMFTRGHQWRRMGRDQQLWSFACLLETASSIQKQGLTLPRESLKPGWFHFLPNKPAEYYYERLLELDHVKIPFTALDKRGRPFSFPVEIFWKDGKIHFSAPEAAIVGGFIDPEDPFAEVGEFLLDPLLFTGLQEEVFDLAAEFGEQRPGEMPDWLLRQVNAMEQSILPWHEYVRLFFGDHLRFGHASTADVFTLPSLLQTVLPPGTVLPYHQGRSPSTALLVDSSGSMSADMLARALGEVDGVLRTLEVDDGLIVIPCDAAAHTAQKIFRANQLVLEGGGGTDLSCGIKRAADLFPQPEALIVLTDGYTKWPEERPDNMQVLIVIVSKQWTKPEEKKRWPTPEWAHTVEMYPWKGDRL